MENYMRILKVNIKENSKKNIMTEAVKKRINKINLNTSLKKVGKLRVKIMGKLKVVVLSPMFLNLIFLQKDKCFILLLNLMKLRTLKFKKMTIKIKICLTFFRDTWILSYNYFLKRDHWKSTIKTGKYNWRKNCRQSQLLWQCMKSWWTLKKL